MASPLGGDVRSLLREFLNEQPPSHVTLNSLLSAVGSGSEVAVTSFLQSLLARGNNENLSRDGDVATARRLISQLAYLLRMNDRAPQPESSNVAVLSLLVDLSQMPPAASATRRDGIDDEEEGPDYSYYGSAPSRLEWRDLMVASSLIEALVGMLRNNGSTSIRTKELVSQILGNLLVAQEESTATTATTTTTYPWSGGSSPASSCSTATALHTIRPYWPDLVTALPWSSYACAAVLRADATTYGTEFLMCLTPAHLTGLIGEEGTKVYAAWMLESLSRREDEAVDALCGEGSLVQALVQQLSKVDSWRPESSEDEVAMFLVPALRAVGNMVTACGGRYVALFLKNDAFVSALSGLLKGPVFETTQPADTANKSTSRNSFMPDCLWLTGCLLCDAGVPGHASTEIGVPVFVPMLVAILVSGKSSFELRRDAVCALDNAISKPPGYESDSAALVPILVRILEQELWEFSVREHVMEALVSLLAVPDVDAVIAALRILDGLLRHVPPSRSEFEATGGVDKLEEVCNHADTSGEGGDVEVAAEMAADLLDDLFDQKNEEEDMEVAPSIQGGQLVFGLTEGESAEVSSHFGNPSAPSPGQGRGRGRTMPAWMMKQQQHTA